MLKYTSSRVLQSACRQNVATVRSHQLIAGRCLATHVGPDDDPPPTPLQQKIAIAKEKLKWRTPYHENKKEWYTKFKVFAPDKNEDVDMIAYLQQPIDLTLKGRRERKERKRVSDEKFMQQFVPDRHQILGNDLAAAHFLVHRGGSVK